MKRQIRDGDLVRVNVNKNRTGSAPARPTDSFLYGTVLKTTHPMRDEPSWTDHLVLWFNDGSETIEYGGELELVSDE